jgi:methylglyoxal synthase
VHNIPLATNVATADSIVVWLTMHQPEEPSIALA